MMLLRSREKVGRYRVLDVLAMTDISVVYKARCWGDHVVLKGLLDPQSMPVLSARMKAERRLRFGKCPYLLESVDWVSAKGQEYIVFPYVEGSSLRDLFDSGQQVSNTEAVYVCLCVLRGLEVFHALGLIHTDIKPANVMLSPDRCRVMLIDFTNFEADGRHPEISRGTLPYASPELLRRERLTPATDIYSVGGILYESMAGKPPHEGPNEDEVERLVLSGAPVDLKALPTFDPDLTRVVSQSLSHRGEDRFPSARQMYEALRPVYARLTGSNVKRPERLAFVSSSGRPVSIQLADGLVLNRNDLDPGNDNLSRKHAVFARRNGSYVVKDLGSTNGTFVNNVPIRSETLVHSGDEVRLANLVMRLL